jgi:NAD+-dependent secondary alcohol dehydrogenase Adh1
MKTNARAVVKLDPVLEPKDIAALADVGLTAYHAVRKAVPILYAGTKAVVIGVGGIGVHRHPVPQSAHPSRDYRH